MNNIDISNCILEETDGVFTYKNDNPIFRKKNLAKKLLKLVRKKTRKKIVFQEPISPLGLKLLKSIERWN